MGEYFYVKETSTGVEYSQDGQNYASGDYCQPVLGTEFICKAIQRFCSHNHAQMALDAGGEVVGTNEGWYGGTNKTVRVPLAGFEAFCQQFAPKGNDRTGMMQTSTGEWVLADDWDKIEGDM